MRGIVLTLMVLVAGLGLSGLVFAEYNPVETWWAIYPPGQIAESPVLFGIQLEGGLFYSYCQDGEFTEERGTYIVSGDSIMITITESDLPDRVGVSFTVTFLLDEDNWPPITFTNAPMLTAGWTQEETISMEHCLTAVRSSSWGKIKSSYR